MLEVHAQNDGSFAVRDIGGIALDPVLAVFATARQADEWMLDLALQRNARNDRLGILLPGGDQGLG